MINYLKNIKLRFYLLAIIPLIFFLYSCNFPTDANNVSGIAIVPGVSVNGIKLGATKAQIEAVMGKQNILGFSDGKYRSYTMYIYTDSSGFYDPFERYKVSFYFLEYGTNFDTVDVISVGPLYGGITEKGIGIGSSLKNVHQVYGLPAKTEMSKWENKLWETYCIDKKWFRVLYKDSLVNSLTFGNFRPIPEVVTCK